MTTEVITRVHSQPVIPTHDTMRLSVHRIVYPEALDARGAKEVVWRGFLKYPDERKDESRWFLYRWRMASGENSAHTAILILANKVPDWSAIPMAKVTETEVNVDLVKGVNFKFELRCAPSIKGKDGKRRFLPGIDNQIGWLSDQGAGRGFTVDGCTVRQDRMWIRRTPDQVKKGREDGWNQPFVNIAGMLTITDPIVFKSKFFGGIGPEKSFGLGMLVIAS